MAFSRTCIAAARHGCVQLICRVTGKWLRSGCVLQRNISRLHRYLLDSILTVTSSRLFSKLKQLDFFHGWNVSR